MKAHDAWATLYEAARMYTYGAITEAQMRGAAVEAMYEATVQRMHKARVRDDEQKKETGT